MINLHAIAVGGLGERWMRDACAEYAKRLGRTLTVTEIDEYRLSPNPSEAQIAQALAKEGEAIRKKLPARAFLCVLCIEGKPVTSPAFADILARAAQEHPAAVFVIGSSHGLDESIKKKAHLRLSFSPMTFPHQLARILLLEQLYRASSIISGGKYHK